MALVSGRPISFRMDLYQPLYVPRPLVVPELFASLQPPAYTAALDAEVEELQQKVNRSKQMAARGAVSGEEHRAALLGLESARRRKEAAWGRLPPEKAE